MHLEFVLMQSSLRIMVSFLNEITWHFQICLCYNMIKVLNNNQSWQKIGVTLCIITGMVY